MRGSFSLMFVAVGLASSLTLACGGDNGEGGAGFDCHSVSVAHGQATQCDGSGQFGPVDLPYSCVAPGAVGVRSLLPLSGGVKFSALCPPGTLPIPRPGTPPGASNGGDPPAGSSGSGGSSGSSGGPSDPPVGTNTSSSGSAPPADAPPADAPPADAPPSDAPPAASAPPGAAPPADAPPSDAPPAASAPPPADAPPVIVDAPPPGGDDSGSCDGGFECTTHGNATHCSCTKCDDGYIPAKGSCVPKGNNGVGNGLDPQPPGDPRVNDGPGTSIGNPGNKGKK